jgi:hypothetical protein
VRQPGGHEHCIAGLNGDTVHGRKHRLAVLPFHEVENFVALEWAFEADVDSSRFGCFKDDPGLGFAVDAAEVRLCEVPIGVDVYRQALTGIEDLNEQFCARPETLHVLGPKDADRVPTDDVAQ